MAETPVIVRELEFDVAKKLEASGCVFVVYEEWASGGDGGHCVPLGVFFTVESAFDSHDAALLQAKKDGHQVWAHEDDDADEADWEVDFHIEAFALTGPALVVADVSKNPGRLLWETNGHQVQVLALVLGAQKANAFMQEHEKLSVINEIGQVVLLADVSDLGKKVKRG